MYTERPQLLAAPQKIFSFVCLNITLTCFCPILCAQQSNSGEYQLKAVYLYNFRRFAAPAIFPG